jgi:hypothetical protein
LFHNKKRNSLKIFFYADIILVNGDIGGRYVRPAAAIVIFHVAPPAFHGFVGMAAKNIIDLHKFGVDKGSRGYFSGDLEPAFTFFLDVAATSFVLKIDQLDEVIEFVSQEADKSVINQEIVKLMAVDSQIFFVFILPFVTSINLGAGEYLEELSEISVVITPNPFDFSGFGKLANQKQQLPVSFFQALEIKIFKDVTQKNQFSELEIFE